jgi:carbonic anhydrase/acetyltransferase-like protein (isoleucine patch superfamily)
VILPFAGKLPQIAADVFLAPTATLIGDVEVGPRSSIWFGAVLRGDDHFIRIGADTNVQDNVVIHEGRGVAPALIGDRVTIGHGATVHGSVVGDLCLIGMGAILLDGCEIGAGSIVAAGALVVAGTRIPPGKLVVGAPGRVARDLTPDEQAHLEASAASYAALAARYRREPWATGTVGEMTARGAPVTLLVP